MSERLTYSVTEAAELLGISRSTAYECIRRGEIPALSLGRRVVIAKATIDALVGAAGATARPPVRSNDCTRRNTPRNAS